jgi:hypothetical protein
MKTIEIRGFGDQRRIEVAPDCRFVVVPGQQRAGGFDEVRVAFSGDYTDDGIEVWDTKHALQPGRMTSDAFSQAAAEELQQSSLKRDK